MSSIPNGIFWYTNMAAVTSCERRILVKMKLSACHERGIKKKSESNLSSPYHPSPMG